MIMDGVTSMKEVSVRQYVKVTIVIESLDGEQVRTITIPKAKDVEYESRAIPADLRGTFGEYLTDMVDLTLDLKAVYDPGSDHIYTIEDSSVAKEVEDGLDKAGEVS